MDFTFDFGWMAGGVLITIVGVLIVVFYKQIADNLVSGVSSYDKVKLVGILIAILGLLITANLHVLIIKLVWNMLFGGF